MPNLPDYNIVGKKPEFHKLLAEFRNELNSHSIEYLADLDKRSVEPEFHKLIAEFRNELNSRKKKYLADLDKLSVEADGDDDNEMKKKPVIMIESLIEHLNNILTPSS